MDLTDYRSQLNEIDDQMLKLFTERMQIAAQIGEYKKQNGLPVLDSGRENQILQKASERVPEDLSTSAVALYSLMMDLSKSYQRKLMGTDKELAVSIANALENTPKVFPTKATVACQGVEGAYSQTAAERLFRMPAISYYSSFKDVFAAIEKGECKYGVVPVENSTAGTVNMTYSLMRQHNFHIVRSVRVKVDHSLVAKPGTKLEEIRAIYSHEQAINQSSRFLASFPDAQIISCANTAAAAKMVAESDRTDVAALSSRNCLKLYGLECLAEAVQDNGDNYTTFICITKDLEIYPGADHTSIMLVLPHTMGSLYKTLQRLYAYDINLVKLESRRLPKRNFEYQFYFDIETSIYAPELVQLLCELEDTCEEFRYLGSYNEVI